MLLTDVPGVLDKSKKLIPELSVKDARKLIADGTISGGMIPKVETCIYALEQGVQGVVIIDGKMQHAVLAGIVHQPGHRHADPQVMMSGDANQSRHGRAARPSTPCLGEDVDARLKPGHDELRVCGVALRVDTLLMSLPAAAISLFVSARRLLPT